MSSPFMITALAFVVASLDAYFGLARKVRSPGPASSIFATRRISMAASPSTGHSKRRASSPSVTRSRYHRFSLPASGRRDVATRERSRRGGHLLDEAGHFRHVELMGDVEYQAMAGGVVERKRAT